MLLITALTLQTAHISGSHATANEASLNHLHLKSTAGIRQKAKPKKSYDDMSLEEQAKYRLTLYKKALTRLYKKNISPVGIKDEFPASSNHTFALIDADNSWQDNLIIQYKDKSEKKIAEVVYGYDEYKKQIVEEFRTTSNLEYFKYGMLLVYAKRKINISKKSGLFYKLYHFNSEKSTFDFYLSVEVWNKKDSKTNKNWGKFPKNIDKAKQGYIYRITKNKQVTLLSKSDYIDWITNTLTFPNLDVNYKRISAKSIKQLS